MTLWQYPCKKGQIAVKYENDADNSNRDFKIISRVRYQAECALSTGLTIKARVSDWRQRLAALTNLEALAEEKLPPVLANYHKEKNALYVIDRALYDEPYGVKRENGKLYMKSSRVVELMKKFLNQNDLICYTVDNTINPGINSYNTLHPERLSRIKTMAKYVAYESWGVNNDYYQLPNFSFFCMDFDELAKEIATLSAELVKENRRDRDKKTLPASSRKPPGRVAASQVEGRELN